MGRGGSRIPMPQIFYGAFTGPGNSDLRCRVGATRPTGVCLLNTGRVTSRGAKRPTAPSNLPQYSFWGNGKRVAAAGLQGSLLFLWRKTAAETVLGDHTGT